MFVIGHKPHPLDESLVNSKAGIEDIMRWARAGGYVLDPIHAAIARKHGVSTKGVMISQRMRTPKGGMHIWLTNPTE